MTVGDATQVFVLGFCFVRSLAKPYRARLVDGVWLLCDDDGCKDPRRSEWVPYRHEPTMVLRLARDRGDRFAVSAIADPGAEAALEAEYKGLGMRLVVRKPLFVMNVVDAPTPDGRSRRVCDWAEVEAIRRVARNRKVLKKHLREDDSVCRLYATFDGAKPVGWVRSIRVSQTDTWVSNLEVLEEHRRLGLGTSLMATMLKDDQRLGVRNSVLTASRSGTELYRKIGYRQIATLLCMIPKG